jgi:FKBP-type peptidyl-prolyl cis-trans isomerase FkpA
MNKLALIIVLFFVAVAGCKKETQECNPVTVTAPASEVETLRNYITSSSITATEDSRGFFYKINSAGSGSKPTICNAVQVNYVGKLTNGTTFDSGSGISFYLSQLILGWQEGIPLVAPGGSITLYLPPSLAYGSSGSGTIPPNSILVFDITLVAVF